MKNFWIEKFIDWKTKRIRMFQSEKNSFVYLTSAALFAFLIFYYRIASCVKILNKNIHSLVYFLYDS